MTILKIILTAMGLFKGLLQMWRDKTLQDVAVQAERARVIESERKAENAVENVRPVTRDNLAQRLRDADAEF